MTTRFRFWVHEDEYAPAYQAVRVTLLHKDLWPKGPVLGPYGTTARGFDALSRDVERLYGTTAAEWAIANAEKLVERSKTW